MVDFKYQPIDNPLYTPPLTIQHLHALGKVSISIGSQDISHTFTENQTEYRVEACQQLV